MLIPLSHNAGATQNEIEESDAEALVKAGVKLVAEGANMPSTSEASPKP